MRIWLASMRALNALVRVLADEARAGAALADKKLAGGEAVGPLHGVPFTVKENIDMAGLATTLGRAGAGASRRASGRTGRRTHARRGRDTDRPHQSARYGASRAHP
jgi:Amidase